MEFEPPTGCYWVNDANHNTMKIITEKMEKIFESICNFGLWEAIAVWIKLENKLGIIGWS